MICAILLLAGCASSNNNQQGMNNVQQEKLLYVKNNIPQEADRNKGQETARHLIDLAKRVPKVKDATAVVLGPYAIVGIDVGSNLERSEVGSIKYSVAESLKKDPNGAQAVVIADPDIMARLKEISADIRNGKPISGIMNELADISGRLMPEIPSDIIEPNPKNGLEKPKQKLTPSEEKNLEHQQQKEAKNQKD